MNIALCSPTKKAYSETFIQAHKHRLEGNIYYYYGGRMPTSLEGQGPLQNSRLSRIIHIIKGKYSLNELTLNEQAFYNSLVNNNIDVVFAEYGFTGHVLYKVCAKLNIPLVVHFHGYDASNYKTISICNKYKEVFRYASYVIAVSKKMYDDLLNLGCSEEKLKYNVYGPADEFFEVQPTFKKKQFISIGRFVEKKAPYYLILSFIQVLREFPETKLILAAKGELLPMCKNLVKYYKLESNIEFAGVLSPEQFRNYLSESLALVQHSITSSEGDTEGTPVSILEAGAAGVPVISTYHAGIPDVITNTENGLLTQEHDVDGMANSMLSLLRDPKEARRMGEQARKVIRENFTIDNHISFLDDLIKKAL